MEDNNKLFVFDRKEVILIFVFMVLIAVTCFTLGVRFGKELSLKHDNYSQSDIDVIDLKSQEEEDVQDLSDIKEEIPNIDKDLELEKEIEKLSQEDIIEEVSKSSAVKKERDIYHLDENLSGRWTIQLAAFDNVDEAKNFADGFIANGLDAVINKAFIEGKGTWFRVSVGLFSDSSSAKEYLVKESSFFKSKDYLIKEF